MFVIEYASAAILVQDAQDAIKEKRFVRASLLLGTATLLMTKATFEIGIFL